MLSHTTQRTKVWQSQDELNPFFCEAKRLGLQFCRLIPMMRENGAERLASLSRLFAPFLQALSPGLQGSVFLAHLAAM